MEIDILTCTGCKWSKIIYSGFKGNPKPFLDRHELFRSADKFEREGAHNPSGSLMLSPALHLNGTYMNSFTAEYNKVMENSIGSGLASLRNHRTLQVTPKNELNASKFDPSSTSSKVSSPFSKEKSNVSKPAHLQPIENCSAIKSLQQKIMDANFSEPRSLFSGFNKGNVS